MSNAYNRKGIILAAGLGTRLDALGMQPRIKPLALVDGTPLLIRTIRSLELAGSRDIIIVLGWQAETFEGRIKGCYQGASRLRFIFNERYELQNGVSVLCSEPFVEDEFILTMADHVFEDQVMHLIRDHHPPQKGATLCVDYKLDSIFDMEDATKVFEENGLIQKIGKGLKHYNCVDTGAFIGTKSLIEAIAQVYDQKGDASLSEGVQLLAQSGRMEVLDIEDAFWQDVDTPEMMMHAESLLHGDK